MSERNSEKPEATAVAERLHEEYAIISDSLQADAKARNATSAVVRFLLSQDAKTQDAETAK